MRRHEIELALDRWRTAERALEAGDPDDAQLQVELAAAREAFHELSAEHMAALIDEAMRTKGRNR
jgi:hypothetical protein